MLLCHKSCKTLSYKCIFNFFNLQKSSFSFLNGISQCPYGIFKLFWIFRIFRIFLIFLILWKFLLKTQECWNFFKKFSILPKNYPDIQNGCLHGLKTEKSECTKKRNQTSQQEDRRVLPGLPSEGKKAFGKSESLAHLPLQHLPWKRWVFKLYW